MKIDEILKTERLYYDGATGTYLQNHGLETGEIPELLNLKNPEVMIQMHRDYLEAGANILLANTFGAHPLKLKDSGYSTSEVIGAGIKNIKTAISQYESEHSPGHHYASLDIGPLGKILKPFGDLAFESAYELFAEMVQAGVKAGAELITIETMSDLYELKAAILAAKECSDLPVFVTATFEAGGQMLTGASVPSFITLAEGLGVDAVGINCGLGPREMETMIETFLKETHLPVIVNANAGLPLFQEGKTTFPVTAEEFSDYTKHFAEMGVAIIGGCCGTNPEYIQKIVEKTKNIPLPPRDFLNKTRITSYGTYLEIGEEPILIGERINPTGKKFLQEALKKDQVDAFLQLALAQEEEGAHVLDVNCGFSGIDENAMLPKIVQEIQAVTPLPLQLDSGKEEALTRAARLYNGIPLINSVNGTQESMDMVFPIAQKYGGVLVALCLDEEGIPDTVERRLAIAEKIIAEGEKYGIGRERFLFDPLALTISSEPDSGKVALETLGELKNRGYKSTMGVSNISFGLPYRELLNGRFFTLALYNGLSAGIVNTASGDIMESYYSYRTLMGYDENAGDYIARFQNVIAREAPRAQRKTDETTPSDDRLREAVERGLLEEAHQEVLIALESKSPLAIITDSLVPALNKVGQDFEEKRKFLPQLLMSADAAAKAFDVIQERLSESGEETVSRGDILVATVKGDIHDIGKNITKSLLENYGFHVIDLGKDVPPEEIVDYAKAHNIDYIGLSSLMTTTLPFLEETVQELKSALPHCQVLVGGAVITEEYAKSIHADGYGKDAMATVRFAETMDTKK